MTPILASDFSGMIEILIWAVAILIGGVASLIGISCVWFQRTSTLGYVSGLIALGISVITLAWICFVIFRLSREADRFWGYLAISLVPGLIGAVVVGVRHWLNKK